MSSGATLAGERILLTGGSGCLGTELRRLIPGIIAPARAELDILEAEAVERAMVRYAPDVVVHAAAYTDVRGAETERAACWAANVGGTRNVVAALPPAATLVQISTDYVFDGSRGMYREEDPPGPPVNYYALSKLVAEEVARMAPRHLVIRTSFRPREWPYPVAFTDVFTSQDYVDVVAPALALAIRHAPTLPFRTLHIATERKSVYELARRRRPDVRPGTRTEAGVRLPEDVSLDVSRWARVEDELRVAGAARSIDPSAAQE